MIFEKFRQEILNISLIIESLEFNGRWVFLVIDEKQAQEFANIYFEGINVDMLRVGES
jgi:hypothetical protein